MNPGNSSVQLMILQLIQKLYNSFIYSMLDSSRIELTKLQRHQLNNQGCKCEMCQKLVHQQTMRIVVDTVVDYESECFGPNSKEYYLKIIEKMGDWDKKPRKIRFALPEICVYEHSQPSLLILKRSPQAPIKAIRDKSKMHMFEIIQFFLEGFVLHNPVPAKKNHRRKSTSFAVSTSSQKYKNECVVIAKYRNNIYNMLTLTQMEGLFKSRQKYMRDGLMYLQTVVCTKNYNQTRINLKLRDLMKSDAYERARNQVKMFHEEIKSADMDFISEEEQKKYQSELKSKSFRQYLEYLTIKIVLAISRTESTIISEAVFKYVHSNQDYYLVDVRVSKIESNEQFWATAAMKAFEYKLSKRMSMMDMSQLHKEDEKMELGKKARDLSEWLQRSTSAEWDEMKLIRARLERLEKQKKSLMQSQSFVEGNQDSIMFIEAEFESDSRSFQQT